MVKNYKNIVRLEVIARALLYLNTKVVFVGGAVASLYADDPARGEVRPTDDIDVVIEIINRGSHVEIEEKLRSIGFINDVESGVICRYQYHDIIVDIMPDDDKILGFTNIWYKDGIKNSIDFELKSDLRINIFHVSYFLASKFEALKTNRRGKDYRYNSDFEDIIYVFDNLSDVLEKIKESEDSVVTYLKKSIVKLLERPYIEEEIAANLEYSGQNFRKNRIINIWKNFIQEL